MGDARPANVEGFYNRQLHIGEFQGFLSITKSHEAALRLSDNHGAEQNRIKDHDAAECLKSVRAPPSQKRGCLAVCTSRKMGACLRPRLCSRSSEEHPVLSKRLNCDRHIVLRAGWRHHD
jgi:hypothetical protein